MLVESKGLSINKSVNSASPCDEARGFGVARSYSSTRDGEASIGRRRSNQLDDDAITAQGLAPPIDADEREQAVLDLVPLAGAGRQGIP